MNSKRAWPWCVLSLLMMTWGVQSAGAATKPYQDKLIGPAYYQETPLSFSARDIENCLASGKSDGEGGFYCVRIEKAEESAAVSRGFNGTGVLTVPSSQTLSPLSNGCQAYDYNYVDPKKSGYAVWSELFIGHCPAALSLEKEKIRPLLEEFARIYGTRPITWIQKAAAPGSSPAKVVDVRIPLDLNTCLKTFKVSDDLPRRFECNLTEGPELDELRKLGGLMLAQFGLAIPSELNNQDEDNHVRFLFDLYSPKLSIWFVDPNNIYEDGSLKVKEEFARVFKKLGSFQVQVLVPKKTQTSFPSKPALVYERQMRWDLDICLKKFQFEGQDGACLWSDPVSPEDTALLVFGDIGPDGDRFTPPRIKKSYRLRGEKEPYLAIASMQLGSNTNSLSIGTNSILLDGIYYFFATGRKSGPASTREQLKTLVKMLHRDVPAVSVDIVRTAP